MREGSFIGISAEAGTGHDLPVLQIEHFAPTERSFARALIDLPGGERVPIGAARNEARRVAERGETIRQDARGRARGALEKDFRRFAQRMRLPASVIAISLFARAPTMDRAEHVARTRDVSSFMETLPGEARMKEELALAFGADRLEQELPSERVALKKTKDVAAVTVSQKDQAQERHEADEREIRAFARAFLPEPWVDSRSVDRFAVASAPIRMDPSYGLPGYAEGICRGGVSGDPSRIIFAPGHRADDPSFARLMAHEAAHANDWARSNTLSDKNRLTLLYAVHARVRSETRAKFPYVEAIQNDDPRQEALLKATEYWAELMKFALTMDAKTPQKWQKDVRQVLELFGSRASQEDMDLVRWYLRTAAPSFKPEQAVGSRQEFQRRHVERIMDGALEQIPPGKARMMLAQPLGTSLQSPNVIQNRPLSPDGQAAMDLYWDLCDLRRGILAPEVEADVNALATAFTVKAQEFGTALRRIPQAERSELEDDLVETAAVNLWLHE